jgi:ABC-type sulfate/molybdate transport systems ATPase subunit
MALPRSPERAAFAKKALERVGMENFLSARGDTLSGGETQRMALARMLACPRELVLLDEPTSAADIAGIDRIESALLEYRRECGCTLIFSTHAPSQAMRLADEILFLEHGVIVEHGPSERVLHAPESAQVQAFLKHWRI